MEESSLLEDGEIADSELNEVLSPTTEQYLVSHQKREPKNICSDESSIENSDESDDDSDDQCSNPKRAKAQSQPPLPTRKQVPAKYKVWSIALQEETLMENLNKCDVEAMDRERSVESYNYKHIHKTEEARSYYDQKMVFENDHLENHKSEDEEVFVRGGKRRHRDMKKRLGRKMHKIKARRLPSLCVTDSDPCEDVARDIAHGLREWKEDLVLNVVMVLGKKKAIDLYNETKIIENNGGMLLMSGERKRTSGGIYFLLVKRDETIPPEDIKSIFADDVNNEKQKLKAKSRIRSALKEKLIREKLLNLTPDAFMPSSGATKQSDTEQDSASNNLEEGEVELTVTNPPPSPATDQDSPPSVTNACSEDEVEIEKTEHCVLQEDNLGRKYISYDDSDDDYLRVDLEAVDMDVF